MNALKNIWLSYRNRILRNCTDEFVANTSLRYWQNRLFAYSVIYLIPFSLIAVSSGLYMAYVTKLTGMIISDVIVIITVLSVAFMPGISVFVRKLMFNGVLYIASVTLLLYLGSFGPGLLYLFGTTIFIVMSLDTKFGYMAVGLNTLICIAIGFFLHFGWGDFEILNQYRLDAWIAVSSNLVFLSATAVVLFPIIFRGLQRAVTQENNLRAELENERAKQEQFIEQLHSKNQELEQFAYTASHDLKEPLRMIRNFMELLELKYGPKLDDKAKKYIYYATDGAKRMTDSLNDLLEYSRVGRLYTEVEAIDMEKITKQVLKALGPDIEAKHAETKVGSLPSINGVPVTIKMLMQNLISNALKYQPEGQAPIVKITCSDEETHWKFCIADNGIGIEEDFQQEVFGIFKRLHSNESYPGNGMGLAISRKIVEQHDGEIWVDSAPGKGSRFYFTISKEKRQ